jgi:two-component system, OmpR family, sensor kinase
VPLRLRLAGLYLILLALAIATMGIVIYLVVRTSVYGAVDDNLEVSTEAVVTALEPLNSPLTSEDIALNRVELLDEVTARTFFQIRDPDGELLYSSVLLASAEPTTVIDRPQQAHLYTQEVGGQRLRTLYTPILQDGENLGTIEVAQSLNQADSALEVIRNSFIAGGLVTLGVTAISAYYLAGRALDPVRQVSGLARHIEQTSDFSRRLPRPGTAGEIRELVGTFNALIERVETVVSAQQEFLADSSHELRRPLTLLRANIDMLNDPALPVPEREAVINEIQLAMQGMSRLVSDLLILSRDPSKAIERSIVDVSSTCTEALTLVRSANQNNQFVDEIEPGLRVSGDAERLHQLVSNLLDNAVRYGRSNGVIQVSLSRVDQTVRLEVNDEGPGIPQQDTDRIFERFYRGEAARRDNPDGAGLGLAIVKYITEAHGGTVSVSSEPESGSTFVVDLPALHAS